MSSSSRTPSGLPPSVIVLGITVVVVAVIALLGISLVTGAWNNAAPVQTGAQALQQATENAPDASPTSDETIVPAVQDTIEPTYESFVIIPPEATPYPTFDVSFVPTIALRSDWLIYQDELEGFSIEYPQGWHIRELPLDTRETAIGYTTSISNYDTANPALADRKGPLPPSLFRFDIIINKPGATGIPLQPGQTIEEWVQIYQTLPDDVQLLEARSLSISGAPAHMIIWQRPGQPIWTTTFIAKDDRVIVLDYWLYSESVALSQTAEQMLESFRFTR